MSLSTLEFDRFRDYLRLIARLELRGRLAPRVDESDIVQETLRVASQRIDDYLVRQPASFRLWLRSTALEQLVDARRRHHAKKRSLTRDVCITDVSSMAIAKALGGKAPKGGFREWLKTKSKSESHK